MTDSVRESIVVDASADAVLAVIGDFAAYPEWQAEVRSAEVLEADQAGRGTTVRFILDAMGLRTTLVLAYRYPDREPGQGMRWTLVESDNVRRDDGAYTLEQLADGRTRVDYELSVEPAVPLPAFVRRTAAKRIVDAALRSMKRRVESRPGQPPNPPPDAPARPPSAHPPAHSPTHPPGHSPTHSPAHPPGHSPTHSPAHPPGHPGSTRVDSVSPQPVPVPTRSRVWT